MKTTLEISKNSTTADYPLSSRRTRSMRVKSVRPSKSFGKTESLRPKRTLLKAVLSKKQ